MEQNPKLLRNILVAVIAALLVEGALRILDAAQLSLTLLILWAAMAYLWLRALVVIRAREPSPVASNRTIPTFSRRARFGSLAYLIIAPAFIAMVVLIRIGLIGSPLPTPTATPAPMVALAETEEGLSEPPASPSPEITQIPTQDEPVDDPVPTSTDIPPREEGTTMTASSDRMVLVFIPEGTYSVGSKPDVPRAEAQEFPDHKVEVGAFWIDKSEVTNRMYRDCVAARLEATPKPGEEPHGCRPHPDDLLPGSDVAYFNNSRFDDYPVVNVSWFGAKEYCDWVGRRLPTESEWEAAASGFDSRLYPWGDHAPNPELANYAHSGSEPRVPLQIGMHAHGSGPLRIHDLAGNVWEWTDSWFEAYPESSYVSDEYGSDMKVIRGGSYASWDFLLRTSVRRGMIPEGWSQQVGFRCALSE